MAKKTTKVHKKKTKTLGHPERMLSWVLVVAVATFFVLATARYLEAVVVPVSETSDKTANMTDFERGQYYFNHGPHADGTYDLKAARKYFGRAIAADPRGELMAWYQLGRIDFLEGKFDDAIYKFNLQQAYFGDGVPSVHYMLGLTYGYKARRDEDAYSWQQAEKEFKNYIDLTKYSPWARVDLAWVYFSQGEFEAMLPVLQEGLDYHPENPWLHNMYGLALLNVGDKENARTHLVRAAELASELTSEEWGMSYPGNDPRSWKYGLREFKQLIAKNLALCDS